MSTWGRLPVRRLLSALGVAALIAFLIRLPYAVDGFWLQLLILAGILAIVAMGFNLTFGVAGQINLAVGAFFAVGAYSTALMTTKDVAGPLTAAVVGMAITAVLAAIVAVPTARLRGLYVAMATLALQQVASGFLIHADTLTNGPVGVFGIARPSVFGLSTETPEAFYYLVFAVAGIVFVGMTSLMNSRAGRAYRSVREDEDAARSLGVRTRFYKVTSFVIGAVCASLAGSLYAHFSLFISPDSFDVTRSIQILTMAVVGGLGSNVGAVVGAFAVTLVPEYLIGKLPEGIPNVGLFQSLIFGTVMLVVLTFARKGLVGIPSSLVASVQAVRVRMADRSRRQRRSRGQVEHIEPASEESLTSAARTEVVAPSTHRDTP